MSALADKRAEIATALEAVLTDGRFYAYPRPMPWTVAPCGWIEQPAGGEQPTSGGGTKIVSTFSIWFVHDGSVEAQVAGLDDIVVQAWSALMQVPQVHPRRWRPDALIVTDVNGQQTGVEWRAAVIEADATTLAAAFCTPTVQPAAIPPELVSL